MAFRTVIAGFGNVAAGYAADPRQAANFKNPTHIQALRAHPAFELAAVIDPDPAARRSARDVWSVAAVVADAMDLPGRDSFDVLVLATPPEPRARIFEAFPALKAVLVEKPLGDDLPAAEAFVARCRMRGVTVAVNLIRRADPSVLRLAGDMRVRFGAPQAVFGTYGNGLRNNGTHLVDLTRILFGEIATVAVPPGARPFVEGPLAGDINTAFTAVFRSGLVAAIQPLRFDAYREISLDIWASRGRVQIVHEGLTTIVAPIAENRQLSGAYEIAHDRPDVGATQIGGAQYAIYDNLAAVLTNAAAPACSADDALATMRAIEMIRACADGGEGRA